MFTTIRPTRLLRLASDLSQKRYASKSRRKWYPRATESNNIRRFYPANQDNIRTIACVARNYADHIEELGNTRPDEPIFFLKPPGSLLFPKAANATEAPKVFMPEAMDLEYEVELAVVVGKMVSEFRSNDIKDVVEGYRLAIDFTARDLQSEAKAAGLPWTVAKGLKTFCPVSRVIPKDKIPDPQNVTIYLKVNGELKQEASTSSMLFDIPKLLRHFTSATPLFRWDLLLTGTPKGVGKVQPGDKITAGVKVNGNEISEGQIEVEIVKRWSGYRSVTFEVEELKLAGEAPNTARTLGRQKARKTQKAQKAQKVDENKLVDESKSVGENTAAQQ